MRGDGARVGFQFQGELNDFLDLTKRDWVIWLSLPEEAAVKHPIEELAEMADRRFVMKDGVI